MDEDLFGSSVIDVGAETAADVVEEASGPKRSRSPSHALEREASAPPQPSAEEHFVIDDAPSAEALDASKELAYYRDESNKLAFEKMTLQKQLTTAKTQLQTVYATVAALEARCATLEEASSIASRQFAEALGASLSTPQDKAPIVVDTAALALAQTSLLRLESSTRENIVLRHQVATAETAAAAWKREAQLWKAVSSKYSNSAVGSSLHHATLNVDQAQAKLEELSAPIVQASTDVLREAIAKFETLLSGACAVLEDNAATAAAEGDWKTVLATLSKVTKDVMREHQQQLTESAKAKARIALLEKCAAENALRAESATAAIAASSLPLAALRVSLSQDSLRQERVVPLEGSHDLDVAATPLLRAALATFAADGTVASGSSPQEVQFLRYAARELHDKVQEQHKTILQLTRSLTKLSDWALAASRGSQPQINYAVEVGSRAARDASISTSQVAVLEQLCSMWAMRAISAVKVASDQSAAHHENQVHRLQAALAALEAQLRVERSSNIALRTNVALLLHDSDAESQAPRLEEFHAASRAAAAEYDAATAKLSEALHQHTSRMESIVATRERHLVRTVDFLRHALHAADRAVVAVASGLGDAPRPSLLLEALKRTPKPSAPATQPDIARVDTAAAVDAAVEARLSALKSQHEQDIKAAVLSSRQEVGVLTRKLNVLQSLDRNSASVRCMELQQQMEALSAELALQRNEVAALKAEEGRRNQEEAQLKAILTSVVSEKASLEAQLASLNQTLNTVRSKAAEAELTHQTQHKELEERLRAAITRVEELTHALETQKATQPQVAAAQSRPTTPPLDRATSPAKEADDGVHQEASIFASPFVDEGDESIAAEDGGALSTAAADPAQRDDSGEGDDIEETTDVAEDNAVEQNDDEPSPDNQEDDGGDYDDADNEDPADGEVEATLPATDGNEGPLAEEERLATGHSGAEEDEDIFGSRHLGDEEV